MNSLYSKNYFEKYAALTLLKILKIEQDDIIQSDCPDLKINIIDMGIEVTQALTSEQAVADKKKKLYSFYEGDPFDSSYMNKSMVYHNIWDAIERKQMKSKHYQRYHTNGLYIFSHCYNLTSQDVIDELMRLDHHLFYQHLYINAVTTIYDYNVLEHSLETYQYSLKELIKINEESLAYEKICPKKRKKIIIDNKS